MTRLPATTVPQPSIRGNAFAAIIGIRMQSLIAGKRAAKPPSFGSTPVGRHDSRAHRRGCVRAPRPVGPGMIVAGWCGLILADDRTCRRASEQCSNPSQT